MALNQIIQHATGTSSHYWRIVETNLNYETKTAEIKLFGYVSEEARLDGKTRLDTRSFVVSDPNFSTYFAPVSVDPQNINQVKNAYLYVKTQQEFSGSSDV